MYGIIKVRDCGGDIAKIKKGAGFVKNVFIFLQVDVHHRCKRAKVKIY